MARLIGGDLKRPAQASDTGLLCRVTVCAATCHGVRSLFVFGDIECAVAVLPEASSPWSQREWIPSPVLAPLR